MTIDKWINRLTCLNQNLLIQDFTEYWTDFTNFNDSIILHHHQHKMITIKEYIKKICDLNIPRTWDIVLDYNKDPSHRKIFKRYAIVSNYPSYILKVV